MTSPAYFVTNEISESRLAKQRWKFRAGTVIQRDAMVLNL